MTTTQGEALYGLIGFIGGVYVALWVPYTWRKMRRFYGG